MRPGVSGPHAAGEENFLLEGDDDSSVVVEGGNNKPGLKAAALAPNLLISSFLRLACLLSCSLKDGLQADMSTTGLGVRPRKLELSILAACCLDGRVMGSFLSKSEFETPVSFCTSSLKLEVSACTKVVVADANSFSWGEGLGTTACLGDTTRWLREAQQATLLLIAVAAAAEGPEEDPSFRFLPSSSTDEEAESLPPPPSRDGLWRWAGHLLGGVIGGQMKVVVPPAFISSCDDGKTGWKVKGLLFFSFSLLHILPHTPVSHQAYYSMRLKIHLDSS